MIHFFLISILFLSPMVFASSKKPFVLIQVKTQLNLTEKILENKRSDLEALKTQLSEVESHLGLIKGFSMQERTFQLYKQKADLVSHLSQTENDIQALTESIQKLYRQKANLSRQISSSE